MIGFRRKQKEPQTEFQRFASSIIGKPQGFFATIATNRKRKKLAKEFRSKVLSQSESRRVWNRYADASVKFTPLEIMETEYGFIKKFGEINAADRVLSIGSGPGIGEAFVAKDLVPKGEVVCLDFAHKMNLSAKRTKDIAKTNNVRIVTASGTAIPLRANSVDKAILSHLGPMDSESFDKLLQETRRVLRKGKKARFFISGVISEEKGHIVELLHDNGFGVLGFSPEYSCGGKSMSVLIAAPKK